ncbi:MAG: alpha/beta fold hydrolase [Nitrospirota bacterium]|nr:alpha/beta fold hydrolase [Nitrospirota bacterium]
MGRFLTCVAAVIIFAGCSGISDKSPSDGALSFSPTPESSKKLIVFVHGVLGDPGTSWTNKTGVSWPDLIKGDDKFQNFTVAIYSYDTPFLRRASGIEEIATRLLRQLEDENIFEKFREVYFIAHSMGGLVVKRALVDLNRPSQVKKLQTVKAVLYIATPAQGANMAEVSSWLSANPQLRDMQPADLNSFLQALENQWQNLIRDRGAPPFPQSFCAYETKPTHGIVTVNRVYATTFCDQNPLPVDEDHSNIAKPSNRESDIYVWARARILETSALAQGQKLQFFLRKTPYTYSSGLNVEGVDWKDNYREYEFTVKNPSKIEQVTDLRLNFALPWPVIVSRLISQEGCESLAFTGNEAESYDVKGKNQITKLQTSWTNLLKIGATTMFPEAVFRGKLIMITEGPPSDSASLTVQYRDGTGTSKKSFFHRISVLDAATGTVKINPEPLKGEQKTSIQFMFKEPVEFKK